MYKKLVLIGMTLVIIGGSGFYIYSRSCQKKQESLTLQEQIVLVERRDLSETVDGDGVVVFSKNGGIFPAYKGTVQKIHCRAGDRVKKGDLLMVLTSDTLKFDWLNAEHKYQTAKLNLEQAQKTLERQKILFQAQGTTIDELESAENSVALNEVALREAASSLELLTQTTDEANFIGGDHRTIMIRAPFNGEVAWVEVKPGQIVSAIGSSSSDSSSNNLLLNLVAEDFLEVEATVDETDIDQVKSGQKARVVLNDANQTEIYGVVTEVGSYGSDDSGVIVFPVKIQFEQARITVRPQMTADISILITSKPDVLTIPNEAIIKVRDKTMVKKLTETGSELTEVQLGVAGASYVEVRSGLSEGDRILVARKDNRSTQTSSKGQPRQRRVIMGGPGRTPRL